MTARKDGHFLYYMQIGERLKELLKTTDATNSIRVHLVFSIKDNEIVEITRLNPLLSDPNFILVETEIPHQTSVSKKSISALYDKLLDMCIAKSDKVTEYRLSLLDSWAKYKKA